MQTKLFKAVVAIFTFALLTACSPKSEPVEMEGIAPLIEIQDEAVIQSEMEIETVDGTPAEKVEIYTEKAKEAQIELQLLLESNSPETLEGTSFLEKFIPTAFAEDSTTEEQMEQLLAEIQIYTELAAEAATESSDPEEIVELLEEVQETQVGTTEIIEEAILEADEEITEILTEAAEEAAESTEEVEDAVAEAEVAVASGEKEVNIEIETDVENFIFDGSRKIKLREMMNPVIRAEKKVRRLEITAEKVEEKLTAGEINGEEAAKILEKIQNQIKNGEEMRVLQAAFHEAKESGDEEAIDAAHGAIKEFNNSATAEKAEEREAKILGKIESLPEEDQAEALEKYEEQKEQQKVRRTERNEFIENVSEAKVELKEARESGDEEAVENLKEQIGGYHKEFQQAQEDKILGKIESLPEEAQAEALKKYEERKIQREETAVRKQETLEKVKADREMLREAKESGDEEAVEAAEEAIQIHREEVKEESQERRGELEKASERSRSVRKDVRREVQGTEVGCQEDARVCPDGSVVGRVALDCEFAACPNESTNCRDENYTCTPEDIPCCPGLKKVGNCFEEGISTCTCATCGSICRPCGNGICDDNENRCNCPEDCKTGAVVCTEDAKVCPDGSTVGRVGPDCEFATCSNEEDVGVQVSCQNHPGPDFCLGGIDDTIASGVDKNGCTIWACK
ncbi:MAG: hypothetical protein ABIE14_02595 [Patescibacteria group bacterium]